MSNQFLKLMINNNTLEIIKKPNAFTLLALAAFRAKRTNDISVNNLEIGEAFIGDYESCGLTRREYRTALDLLCQLGLTSKKTTNKGTVIKILDKRIFDINPEASDQQEANKRPTNDQQEATNKNNRYKNNNINSNELILDDRSHQGLEKEKKDKRNPEINKMLLALKGKIGISAFADSAIERKIAKHCVNLLEKIGKDEFVRRLEAILSDSFKQKNCNRIRYVYSEIKAFIEPQIDYV